MSNLEVSTLNLYAVSTPLEISSPDFTSTNEILWAFVDAQLMARILKSYAKWFLQAMDVLFITLYLRFA